MTTLDEIKSAAAALSPWAHLATIGADGKPDVAPVHPAWEGDTLWVMSFLSSVKCRNLQHNPNVALHWQVTEAGDGVELWGTASVHDDIDTKRRLWNGVFDYDLSQFSPGGADGSPDAGFIAVRPERAVFVKTYGMKSPLTTCHAAAPSSQPNTPPVTEPSAHTSANRYEARGAPTHSAMRSTSGGIGKKDDSAKAIAKSAHGPPGRSAAF